MTRQFGVLRLGDDLADGLGVPAHRLRPRVVGIDRRQVLFSGYWKLGQEHG